MKKIHQEPFTLFLIGIIISLFFYSCQKDNEEPQPTTPTIIGKWGIRYMNYFSRGDFNDTYQMFFTPGDSLYYTYEFTLENKCYFVYPYPGTSYADTLDYEINEGKLILQGRAWDYELSLEKLKLRWSQSGYDSIHIYEEYDKIIVGSD